MAFDAVGGVAPLFSFLESSSTRDGTAPVAAWSFDVVIAAGVGERCAFRGKLENGSEVAGRARAVAAGAVVAAAVASTAGVAVAIEI